MHGRALLQQISQHLRSCVQHSWHVQQLQQHWQHCSVHRLHAQHAPQFHRAANNAWETMYICADHGQIIDALPDAALSCGVLVCTSIVEAPTFSRMSGVIQMLRRQTQAARRAAGFVCFSSDSRLCCQCGCAVHCAAMLMLLLVKRPSAVTAASWPPF